MVIDGSAFFRSIFNAAHVDLSYGAQYDQYRAILLQRLKFFNDNQIQVIVYLDGISDDAKLDTVLTRFQKKITEVHQLVKTIQSNPIGPIQVHNSQIWFPPFIKSIFISLLDELEIEYFVTDGEADPVVAHYARTNSAFVVGNDTDYVMFADHPGFIHIDTFAADGDDIVADIITPASVAEHFGFKPQLLPMFATLAGNDYTSDKAGDLNDLQRYIRDNWRHKDRAAPAREALFYSIGKFLTARDTNEGALDYLKSRVVMSDSLKSLMQYSVEHYTAAMTLPNMENVSPIVTLGTTHFTIPPIAFPHVRKGRCNLAMLNTGALIRGAILEDYTKETCFTACRPINQQVIGIFFKSDTNTNITSYTEYFRTGDHYKDQQVAVSDLLAIDQSPLPSLAQLYQLPHEQVLSIFSKLLYSREPIPALTRDSLFVLAARYWLQTYERVPLTQRDIHALALHHVLNHTAALDLRDAKVPHYLEFIHKGAIWQVISAALFEALYLMDLERDCTDLNIHEWYNGKLFVHVMQCVYDNQLGALKLSAEIIEHVATLTRHITAGLDSRVAVSDQRNKSNTNTPSKPRTNSGNKSKSVKPTLNQFDVLSQEDSMEIDDDE